MTLNGKRVGLDRCNAEIHRCQGVKTLAQVAQSDCPIPGSAQSQAGWGFKHPHLAEGVPAYGRGFGTTWSDRSVPTQSVSDFIKTASPWIPVTPIMTLPAPWEKVLFQSGFHEYTLPPASIVPLTPLILLLKAPIFSFLRGWKTLSRLSPLPQQTSQLTKGF